MLFSVSRAQSLLDAICLKGTVVSHGCWGLKKTRLFRKGCDDEESLKVGMKNKEYRLVSNVVFILDEFTFLSP